MLPIAVVVVRRLARRLRRSIGCAAFVLLGGAGALLFIEAAVGGAGGVV